MEFSNLFFIDEKNFFYYVSIKKKQTKNDRSQSRSGVLEHGKDSGSQVLFAWNNLFFIKPYPSSVLRICFKSEGMFVKCEGSSHNNRWMDQ